MAPIGIIYATDPLRWNFVSIGSYFKVHAELQGRILQIQGIFRTLYLLNDIDGLHFVVSLT